MTEATLTAADLQAGQRLRGILPGQIVTIAAVTPISAEAADVMYRTESGDPGLRTINNDEAARLEIVSDKDAAPPFDANQDDFSLAAEALRIKYAALYDPMAAVNSSDVDPLPHQIRAVYEELLPKIPLRFLLADDPGAGKTIMAGLYLKELILRSDCERAIIVAPGGLVEQWREELAQKFDLNFEVFSPQMVDDAQGRNVFAEHPLLIARMDQLSRREDLLEQLREATWDVCVVDEAHRMSARYSSWEGGIKETKRFELGRLLSETSHNFLLMTATPHAGKEEDFQLFMSLLDQDRFEGKYREDVHRTDTNGLMRRMVKEDLLTFEGKPLFPERKAYTVEYDLSPAERDLYEKVTDYVRTEMGRADRIAQAGDKKRGNNVGFALTVLQRRLASSPEAILRSLERRQDRLDTKLREMKRIASDPRYPASAQLPSWADSLLSADDLTEIALDDFDDFDEETTDEERAKFEEEANRVVDLATAAQTIPELDAEIGILEDLIQAARHVRHLDEDVKWAQLRTILDDQLLVNNSSGEVRKIIIFTEHRDTLTYLQDKIHAQFGRSDSVITIHGGTRREDRKLARKQFSHNPDTVVLLATDAAGEGMNLQRAHLMVNYDLPWNPNRIEQRFGRIHRIGQREVCHLWNMVARDTREGDVFARLLNKIDQMSVAYNGNLFNVLGDADAFQEHPLRDLLIKAIRYGDQPAVREKLYETIDVSVTAGLEELIEKRALHSEMYSSLNLEEVRARMEKARERRLQPGYIASFFLPAFERLGGQIRPREVGRYEVKHVPSRLIEIARTRNRLDPIADKYERVTFELARKHPVGLLEASLLAPGHPLLNAVIEATIEDLGPSLNRGTVFVDRRSSQAKDPMLMFSVEQRITSAVDDNRVVSRHFDYPILTQNGGITGSAAPPYLDFDQPAADEIEAINDILRSEWVVQNHERQVRAWAYADGLKPRLEELQARLRLETRRVRAQVKSRLTAEINYWDQEYNRLEELERKGTIGRLRASQARERASDLEQRLDLRLEQLDVATQLATQPATFRGSALIIPSDLLANPGADESVPRAFARETEAVERRGVAAVLAAERALGRIPVEKPRNNPGFDIESTDHKGFVFFVEVKGRIEGSDVFSITSNEVTFAQTQCDRHRLALVEVSRRGPEYDRVRYVSDAFRHIRPSSSTRSYTEVWQDYWDRGEEPH